MSKKKIKNSINNSIESRSKRDAMIKDGAYDGRYKHKVVPDKKKKKQKERWKYNKDMGM